MNSYKAAQVSSDCSPLLEAGQTESLGTELLEMVPSREEEIKLKEYREDVVSTFVVDDYVRLEFKGSKLLPVLGSHLVALRFHQHS
jgi:hypothetical protein